MPQTKDLVMLSQEANTMPANQAPTAGTTDGGPTTLPSQAEVAKADAPAADVTAGGTPPFSPSWAADAPRGGKAVLNRVLRESAAVPLFLAQTFVQSLRDMGYDSTTSALCEHVDNAIGAGATNVRIYFRQTGRRGNLQTDIMVVDNGHGMAPNVLKVATSFGGSMTYGSRSGIGRFGMGMKTAALSISPVLEIYSWQEPGAVYRMILDTNAIGRDGKNVIELPDPEFVGELGTEIADFFTRPMTFPKDHTEQRLLAPSGVDLREALGRSGTVVYMPECDRLSSRTAKTLVEHAVKEMARIYRRKIAEGLRIWVNNRLVEAVDPTFFMPNARHARVEGLSHKTSKLVVARKVPIQRSENASETADVIIKVFALPIREWSALPRKVLSSDLGVYSGHTISILRNDREVFAGTLPAIAQRHSDASWFRIEIDFPGELDEAFGVAANKQGVRLKTYVSDAIDKAIGHDITQVRDQIKYVQAQNATEKKGSQPSESELRAQESDPFQAETLDVPLTDEERDQMDENLKGLAVALKRETETDEEALVRVKSSKYLIAYRHDPYWPFYHVEHKFGRVVLTVNTAHSFFSKLYEPLLKLDADAEEEGVDSQAKGPVIALELMLFSLGRAQTLISRENADTARLFETFRRSWSDGYRVQLGD
jgi:hypothetical protein